MSDHDLGTYPTAEAREIGRAIVRAGLSAVPLVGGSAAELIDVVIQPAIEERQEAWLNQLGEAVEELRARQVEIRDLIADQRFVTAVIDATRIALGTHLEEKLQLLKSCIVRMGLPDPPSDFMAMRFLRFVDELTPEHFELMTYGRNPRAWFEAKGISMTDYLSAPPTAAMDEAQLRLTGAARGLALGDLATRDLMSTAAGMVTRQSVYQPLITDLGRQLLDFVLLFDEG